MFDRIIQNALIYDGSGVRGYGADGVMTEFDVTEPVQVDCGINLGKSGWFLRELSHLLAYAQKGEPSPLVSRQQVLDAIALLEQV